MTPPMLSLALLLTLAGEPALCASLAVERKPGLRASVLNDSLRQQLDDLTRPLRSANDERSIEAAHDVSIEAMPRFLLRLIAWVLEDPRRASTSPPGWEETLFARMAANLPVEFPLGELVARHRFAAELQKVRRDGGPQVAMRRVLSMTEEALLRSLQHPQERAAASALLTLATLAFIEREGRGHEPWRRAWLLSRQLDGLRRQTPPGPPAPAEHVAPELVVAMIRHGLYPRLPEVAVAVNEALRRNAPPRAAFEMLRARLACDDSALMYFGDLHEIFRRLAPVDQALAELQGRIDARTQYLAGALSIDMLAARWQASVPDTLAALDAQGFARPADVVKLTAEERHARLVRLRADVATNAGTIPDDPVAVRRSVIATQRIEGVDARRHVEE